MSFSKLDPSRPGEAARVYNDRSKWRFGTEANGTEQIVAGIPPEIYPALGAQDPANEPALFKIYRGLEEIDWDARPIEPVGTEAPTLPALGAGGRAPSGVVIPDLPTLGRLLQRSNGILKTWTSPWGKQVHYRAAGQTGARFHLELSPRERRTARSCRGGLSLRGRS